MGNSRRYENWSLKPYHERSLRTHPGVAVGESPNADGTDLRPFEGKKFMDTKVEKSYAVSMFMYLPKILKR